MSMVYSGDSIQDTDGGVLRPISSVMRNRIINGQMVLDQRNAGASVTPTTNGQYTLDRWSALLSVTSKFSIQQNAGAVTPPSGFTNYLGATSLSSYTVGAGESFGVRQMIEGFNVSDLGWGTANAKTVTLSFWVRSSLTGTFGGSVKNSAQDRSYPFNYSIPVANTWTQISVTIAGDTGGTWLTNNGVGLRLVFSLGAGSTVSGTAGTWAGNFNSATGATSVVGTSGATFYITGVQLEVGTQATSFEYRQYQQELALCQRYYYKATVNSGSDLYCPSFNVTTTLAVGGINFPCNMRTNPTALEQSGVASNYSVRALAAGTNCNAVPTFNSANSQRAIINFFVASGLTAGQGSQLRSGTANADGFLAWSAEL